MAEGEREFLLVEYQRIGAELVANETMGDARANLFTVIWMGAVGGIVAIHASADAMKDRELANVVVLGLLGLLVIGAMTFVRLVKRACHTDLLIDALSRLRGKLANKTSLALLPWKQEPKTKRTWYGFGLVQLVMLLDSGTVAMIVGSAWSSAPPLALGGTAAATFGAHWLAAERLFRADHQQRQQSH